MPEIWGVPPEVVAELRELHGLLPMSRLNARLVELRDQGHRVVDLAEAIGITTGAVYSRMRTHNNPTERRPSRIAVMREAMRIPLTDAEKTKLARLQAIAGKPKPHKDKGFDAYSAWFNAQIMFDEFVYFLRMDQNVYIEDIASAAGASKTSMYKRLRRHAQINNLPSL